MRIEPWTRLSRTTRAAAEASGHPLDPNDRNAVVFKDIDASQLATILGEGFDLHVEWTDLEPTAKVLQDRHPQLAISMTPRSAYHSLSGGAIAQLLVARNVLHGSIADDVERAVQEALSNAVIHGNHENPERQVYVSCRCSMNGDVLITVRDEGEGFDSRAVPDPTESLSLLLTRGRGIHLIRQFSSGMEYARSGGCNRLRLTFAN